MSDKYKAVFQALEDGKAYSKAEIASLAAEMGAFTDRKNEAVARKTFRDNLSKIAKTNGMPAEHDATVSMPGQGIIPAWHGWRWKAVAGLPGYDSPQD